MADDIDNIINKNNESKISAIFKIFDRIKNNDSEIKNRDYISIRYKIDGNEFVKNNKNNCKITFDNKVQGLNTFFDLKNIEDETDLSFMFNYCNKYV